MTRFLLVGSALALLAGCELVPVQSQQPPPQPSPAYTAPAPAPKPVQTTPRRIVPNTAEIPREHDRGGGGGGGGGGWGG